MRRSFERLQFHPLAIALACLAILGTGLFSARPTVEPDLARGKVVFDTVCATCHSLTPPAKLAPPMLMIARHYESAFESQEEAVAAMRAWLAEPAAEKSSLPAHAIEMFGVMPPLALPAEDSESVVAYIVDAYDKWQAEEPSTGEGGQHGMMGEEEGMGCQNGQCKKMGEGEEGHQHRMMKGEGDGGEHRCKMMGQGEGGEGHGMKMGEGEGQHRMMMGQGEGGEQHRMKMTEGEGEAHQCPHMQSSEGAGCKGGMCSKHKGEGKGEGEGEGN